MEGMRALLSGAHQVPPGAVAPLPGAVAALIGLAALAFVLIPFLWPLAGHLNAMAHEGAHAVTGSILGLPPLGVILNANATGRTWFSSPLRGPRAILIGLIGYLGPSAFGLLGAKLIEADHVLAVLWVAIICLVLLLFLVRWSFGIILVPVAIALLALAVHGARTGPEELIAYALSWLLLLSGVRVAVAHGAMAGDAWILSAITHLPRRLWALLWLAGTLLAVVVGGKWLVLGS